MPGSNARRRATPPPVHGAAPGGARDRRGDRRRLGEGRRQPAVRRRAGRRRRRTDRWRGNDRYGRPDRDRFRRSPPTAATSTPVDTGAPATVPPDTGPEDTGPPSGTNPAEVYIVGDSDAGTFGPYLETLLDGTNIVDTELNYKVSSGLARPDFFDWPAELAAKVPEVDPDIVVATFGGNDSQGLAVADGSFIVSDPVNDEADWTEEYRAAGRSGDGPHGRERRHGDLGRHPERRQPRRHGEAADPGSGGPGGGGRSGPTSCSSTRGTGSPGATATGPSS